MLERGKSAVGGVILYAYVVYALHYAHVAVRTAMWEAGLVLVGVAFIDGIWEAITSRRERAENIRRHNASAMRWAMRHRDNATLGERWIELITEPDGAIVTFSLVPQSEVPPEIVAYYETHPMPPEWQEFYRGRVPDE